MSFEAYDNVGVLDAPSRRVPNRAMAQRADEDVRGTPSRDAGAYERWATERRNDQARAPSNSDRQRAERAAAEELRAKDPRAGSALGTAARRAVVGTAETALLPYRGARALSGGRLPELSAAEAYAQAESLARDEPVRGTLERQRVQDAAHPDARNLGDATAQVADPFLAAEAMKGGLRLRAAGGVRGAPVEGPNAARFPLLSDERGAVRAKPAGELAYETRSARRLAELHRMDPDGPGAKYMERFIRDNADPHEASRALARRPITDEEAAEAIRIEQQETQREARAQARMSPEEREAWASLERDNPQNVANEPDPDHYLKKARARLKKRGH